MTAAPNPGPEPQPRVLIVEDDARLATLLSEYLSTNGFGVSIESRGDRALDRIHAENPRLVVLDLMLPGVGGLEICQRARESYGGGILILTANKAEVDQAIGLELGADDYVVKPVEPRVLLARIRSLLRRLEGTAPAMVNPAELTVGTLTVHRAGRDVTVDGRRVELTSIEFDLLWLLASRGGEVVTREDLSIQLRGIPYDGVDRSIDVHVSRLRQKLEAAGLDPSCLKAVRGTGYLLVKR